jgi:polyisoprenoid-binding protein YceI
MKTMKLWVAMLGLVAATTTSNAFTNDNGNGKDKPSKVTVLKADVQNSTVVWTGKKVTGEHTGTVKISNGSLSVDNNKLVGGQFDIDLNSIACTDLTDKEYNQKLIGHLKSDDFFGVAKYPKASFKVTKAEAIAGAKAGENNYNITGDLTIKGVTKPVTFPATVKVSGNKADATAKITVDRTLYDIRYGSASFFDSLGDKAINNDFTVDLKLVAGK